MTHRGANTRSGPLYLKLRLFLRVFYPGTAILFHPQNNIGKAMGQAASTATPPAPAAAAPIPIAGGARYVYEMEYILRPEVVCKHRLHTRSYSSSF